jgi:two-component system, OmpR family, phosphate regulon response regulator PhoB
MNPRSILVVEDEKPIRDMIAFGLKRAGFDVREADDCGSAHREIGERLPDLVLADWMLPDSSGLQLMRKLREDPATRAIPVIILTARAEEEDMIAGLDGGADDYVTKPFSPRELLARINAVLRRTLPEEEQETYNVGPVQLVVSSRRVTAGEQVVSLGPSEFRLLKFFMSRPDRVHSRADLLDEVWRGSGSVEERTVDVLVRRLRRALEPSGCDRLVQTVHGVGYRFSTQVEE